MIKKHHYSWSDVERMCTSIVLQMYKDNWRPDYVVGITRGGNVPATIISNMLDVPCHALKVSLRDDINSSESNLWMAEDAYGYPRPERFVEDETNVGAILDAASSLLEEGENYKNILIVDDINDTGATFNWIKKDWESSCMPNDRETWDSVWDYNVRFAVLTENLSSTFDGVRYQAHEVDKAEKDVWLVYPWEIVGRYD